MDGDEGEVGEEFHGEVAIADGVHAILGEGGEVEVIGDELAIEEDGGTGDGARAEGHDIEAFTGIEDAAVVAVKHFHVGEEMVGEVDWLGALEVGVAGDDDFGVAGAEVDEGALDIAEGGGEGIGFFAEIEAQIEGDLVIAASGGVQFGSWGADSPSEFGLDIHVDVFEFDFELEGSRVDVVSDGG